MTQPPKKSSSPSGEPTSFEQTKPGEAKLLLQSAVPTKAKLQLWSEGQRFVTKTRVQAVSDSGPHLFISVPRDPAVQEFETQIRGAGIEHLMCSLHLPTDILFFSADLKRGDPSAFHLKVGAPVFKLQRRRSLRVPFSGADVPIATIRIGADDPVPLVAPVLNASEGGIAITLQDEKEFKQLPVGLELHEIRVNIAGVEVCCPGDVRHAQEIPSSPRLKKHYKIGLRFDGIPEASMERLARFVFETSAKFLGRI